MPHLTSAKRWLSALSDSDVRGIAQRIDKDGIYCAPDFLSADDLGKLQNFVTAAIALGGNQSVSLASHQLSGSGLDELGNSDEFKALFSRLYFVSLGRQAPEVKFYQILRCLTGRSIAKHSLMFHYDSYVITALVPVQIPQSGKRGDFLIIPNTRKIRSNYVLNLADKVILDNVLMQRSLRRRACGANINRISMVPGNLYLFWGYRSIHTNEPVDEDAVRATALFHYADPHADSFLKRRLRLR
ncbi:hypothetical protein J2046_006361 [Rhizobium petrolearium]|uniref:hypothetical protein n=1 Tax=Neorhizobium petrolearium TaxID=515361 RepID=UPI001AE20B72|nr:hypothetical protein [Neorhizobium petrolearium]MBP1848071.1 hypothetical protein [Neorhizobium petrolearium]